MNRRSFFGFACGGLVAGPAALVGQGPTTHKPSPEEVRALSINIHVDEDGNWLAAINERMDAKFAEHLRLTEEIRRDNARILNDTMSRYTGRRG